MGTPGVLRTVGVGQNAGFRGSAGGGGGLRSSGGGYSGGGVLRSAISDLSQTGRGQGMRSATARRGDGGGTTALRSRIDLHSGGIVGASSATLGATPAKLGAVRKGASLKPQPGSAFSLPSAGLEGDGGGMARTILDRNTSLAAARGFIASIGLSGSLDSSDDAVRTLVPDRPGKYRDKMHKGEELIKAGSFMSAYDNFKLASDMVGRFPEPYLNMAHAKFGMNGYGMTAYYIRRALVCMPSLPQVPLRPKSFYSNVAIIGDMVIRLETYLDSNPEDGDALLILAYFRWFADNPDVPAVRSLLERALAAAKSEGRTEAIQIFWRAIVDSKKASGELKAPVRPKKTSGGQGSTSRPASLEPDTSTKPSDASDPAKLSGASAPNGPSGL